MPKISRDRTPYTRKRPAMQSRTHFAKNRRFPLSRKPTVSCLLRLYPNPRRTRFPCSGTQDKSCIFQIALWRPAQHCSASFFVASGPSWTSSVPRKRSILALAVSNSFMSSRALRYSESLPCGNRKFTGPVPDDRIKLYLGRSILGRSILGRMESDKGVVCPFPCLQICRQSATVCVKTAQPRRNSRRFRCHLHNTSCMVN